MGLDIRLPIGLMFAILGAILTVFGLVGDKAMYGRSLGININLGWGIVMLVFGVVMFILGRRGTAAMRSAEQSAEGRLIEEIEHATGEEREKERQVTRRGRGAGEPRPSRARENELQRLPLRSSAPSCHLS